MSSTPLVPLRGRGAVANPPNRFEALSFVPDLSDGGEWDAEDAESTGPRTLYLRDASRSLLVRNDSPDVSFTWGMNVYRGCENGCAYCFARPTHEYLGFSAGLDFETRILVKENAPELLRQELARPGWKGEVVGMSGVTDPYQPAERGLRLTRRCLEILAECRNPVAVITKRELVSRDADLLGELARHDAAAVYVSLTTLDRSLQRVMEPRASTPERRLAAIRALTEAGVPVGALIGPVIPGLTDHELPALVAAAAGAGARFASYVMLRLPHGVKDLFSDWLEAHFPDRRDAVLGRVREIRGGELYDSRYFHRGRGIGAYAETIGGLFQAACRKSGLSTKMPQLSSAAFRRPSAGGQTDLFS